MSSTHLAQVCESTPDYCTINSECNCTGFSSIGRGLCSNLQQKQLYTLVYLLRRHAVSLNSLYRALQVACPMTTSNRCFGLRIVIHVFPGHKYE